MTIEQQIADIQTRMTERVNPLTQAYVKTFGINPHEIPVDGWDRDGYETFKRDANGQKVYVNDWSTREKHPWPDNFDYDVLCALWLADAPTRWTGVRV